MTKTPGKMHMYDMVKIDTTVFDIVGGVGAFKAPPPGSLAVRNSPDRIGLIEKLKKASAPDGISAESLRFAHDRHFAMIMFFSILFT